MYIIDKVQEYLGDKGTLIYLTQFGSHLYGTNTDVSDLDFRGVFIPSKEYLMLKKDEEEYNTQIDIAEDKICVNTHNKKLDIKLFSIYKFIKLCGKCDTNALDVLFSVDINNNDNYVNNRIIQYYNKKGLSGRFIIQEIYDKRHYLIDVNNLQSPCSYAYKQSVKYGIKGKRLQCLQNLYSICHNIPDNDKVSIRDCIHLLKDTDEQHVKVINIPNKDCVEQYLSVCGVEHQLNLSVATLEKRIHNKIEKEYTSQRTKNAKDGNDWKALSHAIRVLFEITQLLNEAVITFPVSSLIMDIKQGRVDRQVIDELFNTKFDDILQQISDNKLKWFYNKQYWDKYLLEVLSYMIIDLDQKIYVFNPSSGLEEVSIIDVGGKKVTTINNNTYDFSEINLVHSIQVT